LPGPDGQIALAAPARPLVGSSPADAPVLDAPAWRDAG
ncbi:MAG: hypothetical protein JWO77_1, partial [Ilumatobacteraceae bacterium]|nr:hypothetical protein [Ilumatobacteraceae bacterium]